MKLSLHWMLLLLFLLVVPKANALAAANPKVVRAVLFFSPTCPSCHIVMEDVLPPITEKYAESLDIVGVDVSQPIGESLYRASIDAFRIPDDRLGVPTLIIGSEILVGVDEIEIFLPNIIEASLAAGGLDWPQIPGLDQVLAAQTGSSASQVAIGQEVPAPQGLSSFIQKFNQDPLANSIAVIVLIGMLVSSAVVIRSYLLGPDHPFLRFPDWLLPVLAIIGLGVASYLSYVEVTRSTAICGPVGNCNSVQESVYARLFGIIPVGLMGIAGYVAILAAWLLRIYGPAKYRNLLTISIWGMAWFGVLFSIYLTFLEPFVIGATCAWCITSAIVMTLILLISTSPAKEALRIQIDLPDLEEEELALI